jgi:hypothetical protein
MFRLLCRPRFRDPLLDLTLGLVGRIPATSPMSDEAITSLARPRPQHSIDPSATAALAIALALSRHLLSTVLLSRSPLHVAGKLNTTTFALSDTIYALAQRLKDSCNCLILSLSTCYRQHPPWARTIGTTSSDKIKHSYERIQRPLVRPSLPAVERSGVGYIFHVDSARDRCWRIRPRQSSRAPWISSSTLAVPAGANGSPSVTLA